MEIAVEYIYLGGGDYPFISFLSVTSTDFKISCAHLEGMTHLNLYSILSDHRILPSIHICVSIQWIQSSVEEMWETAEILAIEPVCQ